MNAAVWCCACLCMRLSNETRRGMESETTSAQPCPLIRTTSTMSPCESPCLFLEYSWIMRCSCKWKHTRHTLLPLCVWVCAWACGHCEQLHLPRDICFNRLRLSHYLHCSFASSSLAHTHNPFSLLFLGAIKRWKWKRSWLTVFCTNYQQMRPLQPPALLPSTAELDFPENTALLFVSLTHCRSRHSPSFMSAIPFTRSECGPFPFSILSLCVHYSEVRISHTLLCKCTICVFSAEEKTQSHSSKTGRREVTVGMSHNKSQENPTGLTFSHVKDIILERLIMKAHYH